MEGEMFPLLEGQGDPGLSTEGRAQATRVCARLAAMGIDAVYVSTLRRTAQTAAPLLDRLGLDAVVDPDLREVFVGEWEGGMFRQKVRDGDPVARAMLEKQRYDVIPGGESPQSLGARVRTAAQRIVARHPDQRVAVFTHGGVVAELLAQVAESRPFAFNTTENASISIVVATPERWLVRRFNDIAHLGD